MTSEPTAESFAEQFGDKPVCKGDGIVIGGELIPYEHEFRVGNTVRDSHGQTGTVTRLSGTRFVNINDQPGYRNCESLTLVSTEHRLYTMQQAIDRIVDGLALEWVDDTQFGKGSIKTAVTTESLMIDYRIYKNNYGHWYSSTMFTARPCKSFDHAKQLCLDDYRKRFRVEIERAAAHGS